MALAKRHSAAITLFDVVPDLSWPLQYLTGGWEQTIEDIAGSKQNWLQEKSEALAADGVTVQTRLADGRLAAAIVHQVTSAQHDLVIKIAEGAGANRSGFLTSTDFRLLRKCPCPVLILKPDQKMGFQNVAVALDVMDDHEVQRQLDQRVMKMAVAFCNGDLELLYAMRGIDRMIQVDPDETDLITLSQLETWETQLAASALQKLEAYRTDSQVNACQCHVLNGSPEDAIPAFVQTHLTDLLVMGTVARSGLEGLLIGNTAERILSNVECSILAMKPKPFCFSQGQSVYSTSDA